MKGNGKNAGALAAMVKGEKPYDQAAVDAALAQFEDTIKKLPTLFPDSTKGLKPEGDYFASPKVWEDKAGFDEHIQSFAKVRGGRQGQDHGSGRAEGDLARHRQAVRRLSRDLPRQERVIPGRSKKRGGRLRRPPFLFVAIYLFVLFKCRVRFTSSPDRGFRRPDWLRCGR